MPPRLWLGVRFIRDNAGIVLGAAALTCRSDDRLDMIGAACNAYLGGFPAHPYARFNAGVFVEASCGDTCLAYQNVRASGDTLETNDRLIADDSLLDRACNTVSMEAATFGAAIYDVELRQSYLRRPVGMSVFGETSISETQKRLFNSSGDAAVSRFTFDPPALSAEPLWVVLGGGTGGAHCLD